jgi:hypothetical protein
VCRNRAPARRIARQQLVDRAGPVRYSSSSAREAYMRQRRLLLIAFALAVIGGGVCFFVLRGDSPALTIDHAQPFWLEFGRGSGWHGLDTVKLDQTGRTVLHRMKSEHKDDVEFLSWQVATLQLSPRALGEVLKAVESNGLLGLHGEYHAKIHDGTQWVLWIKQRDNEKSVYFNNNFPRRIRAFAEQLDTILAGAGYSRVAWQPVPGRQGRDHERELWDSIKR